MNEMELCKVQALKLLEVSGIEFTDQERHRMAVLDFGLGRPRIEGAQVITIVQSPMLRIALLVLLPDQTLPEHFHPAYEGNSGKEEHLRVQYGSMTVYLPGQSDHFAGTIPAGKSQWYACRNGTELIKGESLFIRPAQPHWFQAGKAGGVSFGFYNAVDESRNVFTDPAVVYSKFEQTRQQICTP